MSEKKTILLYNPKSVFYDMPLALLAIGSMVNKEKYNVKIIDGRIEKDVKNIIAAYGKEIICLGVTVLTGSPIKDAKEITGYVKSKFPHVVTIWGGWHPSLFPEQILKDCSSVDITVQGQGEITFAELIEAIENKKKLSEIKGIYFRNSTNGNIIKNEAREMTAMDSLPMVDYNLIDVESYFKLKKNRQFDYISSVGCYFRCTFCADPFVFKRKWSAISPKRVATELAHWYDKFKFTDINFQDETFFTYPERIVEMANLFIEKKLKSSWAATMRADQGNRMSDEDFKTCVKSGLRRLLIGVESGSQSMMDWLMKDIKIEQVYLCAERCKEHGIAVIFPFIVGFPNETDESVESSINMIHILNKMYHKFNTPIFYFKPYPGSKITEDIVTSNSYRLPKTTEEWEHFDYVGSSGPWVNKKKYTFFERYKFYLKAGYKNKFQILKPIRWIARQRCEKKYFKFPVEKVLFELFTNKQKLS